MDFRQCIVQVYESPLFQTTIAAIGGGITRAAIDWKAQFKLKALMVSIISATYIGVFVGLITDYYEMDRRLIVIISLACGLAHTELVMLIKKKILKKIKESDKYE